MSPAGLTAGPSSSQQRFFAKRMDCRVISAFTRVFDALCPAMTRRGTPRLGCLRSRKSLYESGATACACGPSVQAGSRMESYPRSTEAFKRDVSADDGAPLLPIMRGLWPYIWPADRRDLKLRVAAAMALLLAAKLATITVPFMFKWATDALAGEGSAPFAASSWLLWALAAPIVLTIAYAGTRILMAVLTQMRDGIFAQVAMNAVRRLAYRTFEHMHQLSLRFHLERKTGGLTRVLERGRNAIETIV